MARSSDRRGLGRGLSALLADGDTEVSQVSGDPSFRSLPIEHLRANPDQPRRHFSEEELAELAQSIGKSGILQPLVVRKDPSDPTGYQIVAGERRWRAAQLAKLHTVPVLVRDLSDEDVLEISIIENIQRVDLNPVEEAQSFQKLIDRFGHTQEVLAQALGKSRSHIANTLRLLKLPESALDALRQEKITAGHARALLASENPADLLRMILLKSLTVRQAEALARQKGSVTSARRKPVLAQKDADTRAIEGDLSASLGMRVRIDHAPGNDGGTLSVRYQDLDQLDKLLQILGDP